MPSYVQLDGTGDYASTPDNAAFSGLSDFSIVCLVALNDWTPGSTSEYFGHFNPTGNQRSWAALINLTTGVPRFSLSTDGAATTSATASVAPTIADGNPIWIAGIRDKTNGTVKWYTAAYVGSATPPAQGSWSQLGSTITSVTTSVLKDSTAHLTVGASDDASSAMAGKVWRAQLYTGQYWSGSETLVRDCNPSDWASGSTWVAATTGETWTLNGDARIFHERPLAESAGATGAIARSLVEGRAISEVAGATDSVARALTDTRALAESAGATAAVTALSTQSRVLAESAGATATIARTLVDGRSLSEVAGATEAIIAAGDQFGRPISDLAAGSWTTVPLWSKVDETTADDSDFISSEVLAIAGTTSSADLALTALEDPVSGIDHQLSLRTKATFTLGSLATIKMELREGSSAVSVLVATLTATPSTSFTTYTYTLSGGEAAAIGDYTQLFVRLYGVFGVGNLGGVQVSWLQLDTPVASSVLHGREIFESAGATDAIARSLVQTRALAENAGATDSVARSLAASRTLDGSAGATDAITRGFIESRSLSEFAGATDAIVTSVVQARLLAESAGATGAIARALSDPRTLAESAGATDALSRQLDQQRTLTESAGATESVTPAVVSERTLAESAGAVESIARQLALTRSLSESAGATDAVTGAQVESRTLAESAGATDAIAQFSSQVRAISETAGATVTITTRLVTVRELFEVAGAVESASFAVGFVKTLAEVAGATGLVVATLVRVRAVSETAGATATVTFLVLLADPNAILIVGTEFDSHVAAAEGRTVQAREPGTHVAGAEWRSMLGREPDAHVAGRQLA